MSSEASLSTGACQALELLFWWPPRPLTPLVGSWKVCRIVRLPGQFCSENCAFAALRWPLSRERRPDSWVEFTHVWLESPSALLNAAATPQSTLETRRCRYPHESSFGRASISWGPWTRTSILLCWQPHDRQSPLHHLTEEASFDVYLLSLRPFCCAWLTRLHFALLPLVLDESFLLLWQPPGQGQQSQFLHDWLLILRQSKHQ